MIAPCTTCADWRHDQDKMYGHGMRVHNQMNDPNKSRCTVCGNVRGSKIIQEVKETKE